MKLPNWIARPAMKMFLKMASATQVISSGLTPMSPELIAWMGGSSVSGKTVNDTSSLAISTAWSCMRIISEAIGTIPWAVYERSSDGSINRVDNHPLAALLVGSPNVDMTPVELRETKTLNLCQDGNAYSLIERLGGDIVSLYPVRSRDCLPKRKKGNNTRLTIPEGTVFYSIKNGDYWQDYTRDLVWHVKGFGNDGFKGLSPIGSARESMGFALATDEYGSRFFSQGGRPSGIVTVPNFFSDDQRAIARENLQQMMGGLGNAHKFALFEGGMKPEPWGGMPLADMEFVNLKKFSVLEMCRIFRVPPHMVAEVERGASYASVEMLSAEFVMFTLMPYLTRYEASATKWLFKPEERAKYFLRFDYEATLRADSKARAEYISAMCSNGLMSRNEGRVREGLNKVNKPGMDDYTVQVALTPIGKLGQLPPKAAPVDNQPGKALIVHEQPPKAAPPAVVLVHVAPPNITFAPVIEGAKMLPAPAFDYSKLPAPVVTVKNGDTIVELPKSFEVKGLGDFLASQALAGIALSDETRKAIEGVRAEIARPRKIVYDPAGEPIGTEPVPEKTS